MSKVWPIKGIVSFKSILDFQIYSMALYTPFSVISLVGSALIFFTDSSNFEFWDSINQVITLSCVFFLMFIYDFPGLAHLNRVSTGKIICSYMFWSVLLGVILGSITSFFLI